MRIIITLISCLFLCTSDSFATFSSDLDTLAKNMASALKLSPQKKLSITSINIDKNYMMPLNSIFRMLREKLSPYSKGVCFNPFKGDADVVIQDIILSDGGNTAPIILTEKKLDSLILSGYIHFFNNDKSKITFNIKIIDLKGHILFESDEYTILQTDCPTAIGREIFDELGNDEKFNEIKYKGKIIKEFDDLFHNTPNNNLLVFPREYRFNKKNPYAIKWQVELIRDILTRRYGITFTENSSNSVTIEQSGSVVFSQNGKSYSRAQLVDGEPLLPEAFPEEYDTYYYFNTSRSDVNPTPVLESDKVSNSHEINIRDQIYTTFNKYYPELFNNFNYEKLDEIYYEQNKPSILVGQKVVDDPRTGKEVIRYAWKTKSAWLNNLRDAHDNRQRRFRVKTSVMGIFNDNLEENRYWAIVKQDWNTLDLSGHVVYEDDGFLIVNFDFDADTKLRDFKIYYRLWFYDYKYDDLERNIKRYQKLEGDVRNYFVDTLGGINVDMKNAIKDFIVDKVKRYNIRE